MMIFSSDRAVVAEGFAKTSNNWAAKNVKTYKEKLITPNRTQKYFKKSGFLRGFEMQKWAIRGNLFSGFFEKTTSGSDFFLKRGKNFEN